MRKLSLQQFAVSWAATLEEDTEFYRLWEGLEDEEFNRYFVATLRRATHIMGSKTYRDMAAFWPKAVDSADVYEREIAAIMNDTPKVVFSRDPADRRLARGADRQRRHGGRDRPAEAGAGRRDRRPWRRRVRPVPGPARGRGVSTAST